MDSSQSKLKLKNKNKSTIDIKNRKKIKKGKDEESEEEDEGNEEEEGSEEDESKGESEEEEEKKKGKTKKKDKNKKQNKGKSQKQKGKDPNRSAVLRNRKKFNNTFNKKANRSAIIKKKNLLNKIKDKKQMQLTTTSKPKRSQSVKTRNRGFIKNKNQMSRTNRSESVGKKTGFFKNKNKIKTNYNRTTRSATKFIKKNNKPLDIKKRSKTPNTTRYKNKFYNNNKKLKENKLSRTHMNIRSLPKIKNKNYMTQRSVNTNYSIKNRNRFHLSIEGYDTKRKNFINRFGDSRRVSDGSFKLRPLDIRKNKFMQNTQNFFNPSQRTFNLFNRDFEDTVKEKEQGFFNRITLYPKYDLNENNNIKGDNLNPYSTNWPSSFLKIGYSSGFYYDDYQDGVPILRLKRLRHKIILPPIQNSRYSQISEKIGENQTLNFNYMSRQERINYILNTENNNNNAFNSVDARRKLLDKFHIKGFDLLPKIENKNSEEEEDDEEEDDEEGEEKEDDEDDDEEGEEKEDDNDDEGSSN